MPNPTIKLEGDGQRVFCLETGEEITDAVTAQTNDCRGPSYTVRRYGWFGRPYLKTIRHRIYISRPAREEPRLTEGDVRRIVSEEINKHLAVTRRFGL